MHPTFRVRPERASAAQMGRVLHLSSQLEHATDRRRGLVHLLALAGVPLFLEVQWPVLFGAHTATFVRELWGLLLSLTLVSFGAEWINGRRLAKIVEKLEEAGRARRPDEAVEKGD